MVLAGGCPFQWDVLEARWNAEVSPRPGFIPDLHQHWRHLVVVQPLVVYSS